MSNASLKQSASDSQRNEFMKDSFGFKMSKIVAELTQVVHMLFTRNHEREVELDGLKASYEEEIVRITKQAQAKTEKLEFLLRDTMRQRQRDVEQAADSTASLLKETQEKMEIMKQDLIEERSQSLKYRELLTQAQKELNRVRHGSTGVTESLVQTTFILSEKENELTKLKSLHRKLQEQYKATERDNESLKQSYRNSEDRWNESQNTVLRLNKNILELLSSSEKGRLRYGVNKRARHQDPKLFIPLERAVVNIKESVVVLENCEESDFAREEKHLDAEHAKSFLLSFEQSKIAKEQDRTESIHVIDTSENLQTFVQQTSRLDMRSRDSNVKEKSNFHSEISHLLSQQAADRYLHLKHLRAQRLAAEYDEMQRFKDESKKRANQIKDQHIKDRESRSKILLTRIEEAENRRKLKIQQGKDRLKSTAPLMEKIEQNHDIFFRHFNDQSNQGFQSNTATSSLRAQFESIYSSILSLVKSCRIKNTMEQSELDELSTLSTSLPLILNQLCTHLERLRKEEQEKERKRQEQLKREQEEAERAKKALLAERQKELSNQNPENHCPSLPKEFALSVSRAAYHHHKQLASLLEEYEVIKKRFVSDKSNMKLIMSINKAISVPVSSITSRSGSDIKNKLNDLNNVLKGVNIKVNNQTVCLSDDALSYANLCMAQKFVKQAEGQVSSSHNAAFCLALAIVGVWSNHEVIGKLFLAQLQSKCPFVIPWYIPRQEEQTEEEHNRMRGYLYGDDGGVEKQDKYLRRMSGFIRTYFAIVQSPLPPGVHQHPHGVAEGWKWVARMLNLDPRPDVTATVLFDFLDVSGHSLIKSYGKQFEKILNTLAHDYFPKIEKVTNGGGGPVQRLQMFLKDCIKKKELPVPDGYLSESFWSTYHHTGVIGS